VDEFFDVSKWNICGVIGLVMYQYWVNQNIGDYQLIYGEEDE
jgi:hypothetical protein